MNSDLDQRVDAVVTRIRDMVDPLVRAAVDEVLGTDDNDLHATLTVEHKGSKTVTIYTTRTPTGTGADFDAYLAERGIGDPMVKDGGDD